MEEKGLASLRAHAGKYVEALLPPAEPAPTVAPAAQQQPGPDGQAGQPGQGACAPSAVRTFCEEAVKHPAQQQQMALLSDAPAVR